MTGEIDEAVFGELVALGPEVVEDLVTTFCADSARLERELAAAVAARDAAAIAHAAHDLKSTSGALGAIGVLRIAAELEHAARGGAIGTTEELGAALAAARAALRARI